MRVTRTTGLAAISLSMMLVLSSSRPEGLPWAPSRFTKIYRVAVLPICNPGTACPPDFPAQLERYFFTSPHSVSAFVNDISMGQAKVVGKTLSWQRPQIRLRSSDDLMSQSEQLITSASAQQVFEDDYDVIFFYAKLNGPSRVEAWPQGQILKIGRKEATPGLVFMVNPLIYQRPQAGKLDSAISPSTSWARELLRSIGLSAFANALNCENLEHLSSCNIRRAKDPFSILGDSGFSLSPNLAMKRSVWTSSRIKKIDRDGDYALTLNNQGATSLEIPLPKPLALNESTKFDRIYVEKKALTRFDKTLRRLHISDIRKRYEPILSDHGHGAFLYLGSNDETTALIDANPGIKNEQFISIKNSLLGELADTQLLPGRKLRIFDSAVTIEITRATARQLLVRVNGISSR